MATLLPEGKQSFQNSAGAPLVGGKVYTYDASTSTPRPTYQDAAATIPNTNPIILDARGEATVFWSGNYKVVLKDASDVTVWTVDFVSDSSDSIRSILDSIRLILVSFASSTGSTLMGWIQAGIGAVLRTVQDKLRERVSVKDFEAKGDFNPATGLGTDDRLAIQAALTYAAIVGNCNVYFPPGKYYLGTGYTDPSNGAQIVLGGTAANSAVGVYMIGDGAEIFQGASGKAIGVFGCNRAGIKGFMIYGFTGGVLTSNRENDAIISVNYYSKNINICDNYLTNSLGDCIYLGGALTVAGGGLGYECRNVNIKDNVLKKRYGNGVMSFLGGTLGRTCIAVVDAVGVDISDNLIYGNLDFEPNLNGQNLVAINVHDNQFRSGNVTAQAVVGSAYWYDEPINLSGGSVIDQTITITGVAGAPVCFMNTVVNNTFQYGLILHQNAYTFASIDDNVFQAGLIVTGDTSGANNTNAVSITNNIAYSPRTAETTFIKMSGMHTYGLFANNRAINGFTYCINNNGASTGDGGRCSFMNNSIDIGTVIGLTLLGSSVEAGSVATGNTANPATYSYIKTGSQWSLMPYVNGITGAQTLDWNSIRGNVWYLIIPTTTAGSVSNITNSPGDGFMLTIVSGASGGGGSLTFTQGTFRNKGNVDAVLLGNQTITYVSRASLWFEVSRGF